jgi:hypothetical protein
MPVTIEQNIAIKKAIRNDLRYIVPGVPNRWFYKRGPWSPRSAVTVQYIEGLPPGEGAEVPGAAYPEVIEKAMIDIATAATHIIVPYASGRRIKIHFLTLTVGGEVNMTLYDGLFPFTGAMDFGGTSEPRGIVMPPDGIPIPLHLNADFKILLSAAVQVSGFVLYSYVAD